MAQRHWPFVVHIGGILVVKTYLTSGSFIWLRTLHHTTASRENSEDILVWKEICKYKHRHLRSRNLTEKNRVDLIRGDIQSLETRLIHCPQHGNEKPTKLLQKHVTKQCSSPFWSGIWIWSKLYCLYVRSLPRASFTDLLPCFLSDPLLSTR